MRGSSHRLRNTRRRPHGSRPKLTGTIPPPRDGPDREALEQRKDRIERRIADLQAWRLPPEGATAEERLVLGHEHAREAEAAAQQALVSCRDAYLRAALAHDRAADAHERSADAGHGELTAHVQMIEFHRAAAKADRRRAEEITEGFPEAG